MTRNEKYIAAFQSHIRKDIISHLKSIFPSDSYFGLIERMDYVYVGVLFGKGYTLVDPDYVYDPKQEDTEEQIEIARDITGLPIETVRKIFKENDL